MAMMNSTNFPNEESAMERNFKGSSPNNNWNSYRRMSHLWEKAAHDPAICDFFARYYDYLVKILVHEQGDQDILHDVFMKMTAEYTPIDMPAKYLIGRAVYLFFCLKRSYKGDDESAVTIFGRDYASPIAKNKERGWSDDLSYGNSDGDDKGSGEDPSEEESNGKSFCFVLFRRCA